MNLKLYSIAAAVALAFAVPAQAQTRADTPAADRPATERTAPDRAATKRRFWRNYWGERPG